MADTVTKTADILPFETGRDQESANRPGGVGQESFKMGQEVEEVKEGVHSFKKIHVRH